MNSKVGISSINREFRILESLSYINTPTNLNHGYPKIAIISKDLPFNQTACVFCVSIYIYLFMLIFRGVIRFSKFQILKNTSIKSKQQQLLPPSFSRSIFSWPPAQETHTWLRGWWDVKFEIWLMVYTVCPGSPRPNKEWSLGWSM